MSLDEETGHTGAEGSSSGATFVFPLEGLQYLQDGSREILVDLNQVAMIPPNRAVRSRRAGADDVAVLAVVVAPVRLAEITGDGAGGVHGEWGSCSTVPFPPDAQRQAHALAATPAGRLSTAPLSDALSELVRRAAAGRAGARSAAGERPYRHVQAVKAMIATAATPLSLPQIASRLGVTPTYLTDLFRRAEGLPVHRYQMRHRLARSLRLLAMGEDLGDVALELGFSSHSHFSSAFRATFGRTPSAFRDSLRGGPLAQVDPHEDGRGAWRQAA